MQFTKSTELPCDCETAFAYHERRGALDRLMPPSDKVEIKKRAASIKTGEKVEFKLKKFGIPITWKAEHTLYEPPNSFQDVQRSGPFSRWEHTHGFTSGVRDSCILTDEVEYEISRFSLAQKLAAGPIATKLEKMFAYRHRVTLDDLAFAQKLNCSTGKRIVISGASGALGRRITALATVLGHQVIALERVKDPSQVVSGQTKTDSLSLFSSATPWHVESGTLNLEDWKNVDAIIHLAGASIAGKRWTESYKSTLYKSRVPASEKLFGTLSTAGLLPASVVTASGVGIYPSSEDEMLVESVPPANDFLGGLAHDWEAASRRACEGKTRWCAGRLAMVLDPQHGGLVPLLWQCSLGGSGRIGDGEMYWSWIERDDAASALLWLALNESCQGPYNLSAEPVSNRQFMTTLAQVMRRPNWMVIPEAVVKLGLGELANGLLLRSNRCDNSKLKASGYPMRFSTLGPALQHLL